MAFWDRKHGEISMFFILLNMKNAKHVNSVSFTFNIYYEYTIQVRIYILKYQYTHWFKIPKHCQYGYIVKNLFYKYTYDLFL